MRGTGRSISQEEPQGHAFKPVFAIVEQAVVIAVVPDLVAQTIGPHDAKVKRCIMGAAGCAEHKRVADPA